MENDVIVALFTDQNNEYHLIMGTIIRNYHIYTQLIAKNLSIEAYSLFMDVNLNL